MRLVVVFFLCLLSACQVIVDYPNCARDDDCAEYSLALGRTLAEFWCEPQTGVCREWGREVCGLGDNDADGVVDEGLELVVEETTPVIGEATLVQGRQRPEYLRPVEEGGWRWSRSPTPLSLRNPLVASDIDDQGTAVVVVPRLPSGNFSVLRDEGETTLREVGTWPSGADDFVPASVRIAVGGRRRVAISYLTAAGVAKLVLGELNSELDQLAWGSPTEFASASEATAVSRLDEEDGFLLAVVGTGGMELFLVPEFETLDDVQIRSVGVLEEPTHGPLSLLVNGANAVVGFGADDRTHFRSYEIRDRALPLVGTREIVQPGAMVLSSSEPDSWVALIPDQTAVARSGLVRVPEDLMGLDAREGLTSFAARPFSKTLAYDGELGYEVVSLDETEIRRLRCCDDRTGATGCP